MLDPAYLKSLLTLINDKHYTGMHAADLADELAPESEAPIEFTEAGHKFKYHMDEARQAGLIRQRDKPSADGWGLFVSVDGHWSFTCVALVLTPVGGEFLEELNKPKGIERLKNGLRSVGAAAGTEALKFGVAEVLKAATSGSV
ncbi:hypothetical protein [Kushneria indalinina]|uniref:DUF2513 domain-containing protein n=1 Tax=Kushneria indalinina DSM 14324 TaxID=1122140 RepID=A0A3D9DVZ4_9GAMM|nr:hypothetical protein [Kushneria indalinina]REC94916.1 hypothetical protein C8D72_1745 [Kushneria indalinina DSM 14324]